MKTFVLTLVFIELVLSTWGLILADVVWMRFGYFVVFVMMSDIIYKEKYSQINSKEKDK